MDEISTHSSPRNLSNYFVPCGGERLLYQTHVLCLGQCCTSTVHGHSDARSCRGEKTSPLHFAAGAHFSHSVHSIYHSLVYGLALNVDTHSPIHSGEDEAIRIRLI